MNLLSKSETGDLAAYVLNGEWDLLGNVINQRHILLTVNFRNGSIEIKDSEDDILKANVM